MEIMIVVAIIGLIAAMGVPSMLLLFRTEGMRKAVDDVQTVCGDARARAILQNTTTTVVFHPGDRSFSVEGGSAVHGSGYDNTSKALPDGVDFAMLDVNLMDFSQSDFARVRFFPNGTCDEMTIVLHSREDWRKITLEFSTGLTIVSDVDK